MTEPVDNPREILRAKLNLETGRLPWQALQRYFAMGNTVAVAPALDLVEVGVEFTEDNRDRVAGWLESGEVVPVSDEQARQWLDRDVELWCLVVRPWVLVQDKPR